MVNKKKASTGKAPLAQNSVSKTSHKAGSVTKADIRKQLAATRISQEYDVDVLGSRTEDQTDIKIIAWGDLVLRFELDHDPGVAHSFRVDSAKLKASSGYFKRLLQPGRFAEASTVQEKHTELQSKYEQISDAHSKELPTITIKDIGRISAVKAVDSLLKDFLLVLHDVHAKQDHLPPSNLANLAIVADRFDALKTMTAYARGKQSYWMQAIDAKASTFADLPEDKTRQRLLIGMLLDDASWVSSFSYKIIMNGWVDRKVEDTAALWWDLPRRYEEELSFRRKCILETIQSVQTHFIDLYSSRERQCRLGYDSSPQCDMFQLGEMIKFFSRKGTLRLQGLIAQESDSPAPFKGNLHDLFHDLRFIPEYQINNFHMHCGIRTRIFPKLELLSNAFQHIGIHQEGYFPGMPEPLKQEDYWMDLKPPLVWNEQDAKPCHLRTPADSRAMFMATEKIWT